MHLRIPVVVTDVLCNRALGLGNAREDLLESFFENNSSGKKDKE